MATSRATVRIERPAADVFAAIVSHSARNEPAWEPEVLDVRPVGSGSFGLGSRAIMVRRERGRTVETTYEITAFEPPHRLAARHLDGPMGFALEFVVQPITPAASDVTVTVDIAPRGAMRVLAPLFALMGPRRNLAIARRMAAAIESVPESEAVASQPAALATD